MVLVLLFAALGAGAAHAEEGRYFPQTGHTLDPAFADFFDSSGGAPILGYPVTESFVDFLSGFLIQYFENARLELVPNAAGEVTPRMTDLGVLMGGWELPLEADRFPIGTNPGCRYYAESGHQVCHAFLDYYESNGGPGIFGLPVTELRFQNDRMVQYFQRFRLDWYPESEDGDLIRIAPLGRDHFQRMGYEASLMDPVVPGDLEEYPILELSVSSSVLRPLIGSNEVQQVYLFVSDQNRQPVEGASALLTIYLPDGAQFRMMPITDTNGVSQMEIPLAGVLPGTRVALEYTVVLGELSALSRDSFYVWY